MWLVMKTQPTRSFSVLLLHCGFILSVWNSSVVVKSDQGIPGHDAAASASAAGSGWAGEGRRKSWPT
jgi:hypothetical protein